MRGSLLLIGCAPPLDCGKPGARGASRLDAFVHCTRTEPLDLLDSLNSHC